MTTSPQGTAPGPAVGGAENREDNPEPGSSRAQRVRQRLGRFGKGLGDAFGHLFGDPKADLLAELTEQAPDDGQLDQGAKDLVSNILNVGDQTVEDVVIARADMVAVPTDFSLESILDLAVRHGHSRFPSTKKRSTTLWGW